MNKRFFMSALAMALGAGLAGCGHLQSNIHPTLPLTYGSALVQQQLSDVGVRPVFMSYWNAYQRRDWSARFHLEQFGVTPPEGEFYVRYHGLAWELVTFDLVEVSGPDDKGRWQTVVRSKFRNPSEPDQTKERFVVDKWLLSDGEWRHLNQDPMLNGMRPVD